MRKDFEDKVYLMRLNDFMVSHEHQSGLEICRKLLTICQINQKKNFIRRFNHLNDSKLLQSSSNK